MAIRCEEVAEMQADGIRVVVTGPVKDRPGYVWVVFLD